MRFKKTSVLIAPKGGEEILQTYLAPNKILAIKKKRQMCLQNVRWLKPSSTGLGQWAMLVQIQVSSPSSTGMVGPQAMLSYRLKSIVCF